ncbi:MAG: maltose alpha-D-glucosyltransferase [Chloroflexaceae bacterium]|nr:maltose alpha-D-glucosyltransferase [Chloroflexaceae bacterium]
MTNQPALDPQFFSQQPDWYKDAIIYEVHVRAFEDSDGDGIGDFKGLTNRLDYLRDLGITAIWLLPFSPSPLRDDGYDTADYMAVHQNYGHIDDFKIFLDEAHKRGLYVITELVLNHTSDQHPWFQRARTSPPGSSWRDFYVWSETPDKYKEARIIFTDTENSNWAWDPIARAYYWHRFFSHQPDLNFDHPEVRQALLEVVDFWFNLGVDGLRLDAVPYLYEREGSNCENLPETHAFLQELRAHVDARHANRMLLAEANQWPEDAVAYFGEGNECQMSFHFPLMPRLFMSVWMEDRFPIIDIMRQTPAIPDNCQWAVFLRNHDELTLEMVTDEDRDYMYRVYAQNPQARINVGIRRRLSPLLGNHRRRIELLNGLLFSMPGTPVIYYGDEIGMGDNIYLGDRNGVRTPMQWSPDRNAGFSRANPQQLYLPIIIDPEYHYEAVNVEAQQNNTHSLLWWMRRLIALRKRFKAFGRGSIEFLQPDNRKVLVFMRQYEDEQIMVIANLSRFTQAVEIDLSAYNGMVPVEMFGRTRFPPIGELPYFLTLAPHTFFWFLLEPQLIEDVAGKPHWEHLPVIAGGETWDTIIRGDKMALLEAVLPGYIRGRRWFGGKSRVIQSVQITESIAMPQNNQEGAYLTLINVRFTEGDPQIYALPITFATGERAASVQHNIPQTVIALLKLKGQDEPGVLYDALWDRDFSWLPLYAMAEQRRFKGLHGEVIASTTNTYTSMIGDARVDELEPSLVRGEQSNTSVIYGDRFIMKLFRRVEPGINPDLEVGRFLTDEQHFANTPPVGGALEYRKGKDDPATLAILQGFVPNEGDAWVYTLDTLGGYFERILSEYYAPYGIELPTQSLLQLATEEAPPLAYDMIGPYLESARLLGQRTAEMHLALSASITDPAFAPEEFTSLYQRSIYQTMRSQVGRIFQTLGKVIHQLPAEAQEDARRVHQCENTLLSCFQQILQFKIQAVRIRCHGDYHLGQILYTGNDFMIIDFEGEPAKSLSERRRKRSPLTDVAGMLRSFHYAAHTALFHEIEAGLVHPENVPPLQRWAQFWYIWVSTTFLKSYLDTTHQAVFLPRSQEEMQALLQAYLLDKAVYELGYELNNRPHWVRIPLWGIAQLLEEAV